MNNIGKEKPQSLRVDLWLKNVHIIKKRTLANELITAGNVKVNGEKVKPSKLIKIGDNISVKRDYSYFEYIVKDLSLRPVPSKSVSDYYDIIKSEKFEDTIEEKVRFFIKNDKINKMNWKKTKDNKKLRRELNRFKYGE